MHARWQPPGSGPLSARSEMPAPDGLPAGFTYVYETTSLRLWVDEATSQFALEDMADSKCFFSFPLSYDDDPIAITRHKRIVRSHIAVSYLDAVEMQTYTAYSYMDSEEAGGFTLRRSGNGLSLEYAFPSIGISLVLSVGLETADGIDSLVAKIENLGENDRNRIISVDVLPFFGAARTDEQGVIFVPDGAGALINLNNGKVYAKNYLQRVYGGDKTATVENRLLVDEPARLPVFGINAGANAFTAIIEQGDALAEIEAGVSGVNTSFNNVFSRFIVRGRDIYILGSSSSASTNQVYQNGKLPDEIFQVRYLFQNGENADPSGMARSYRDYLQSYRGIGANKGNMSLLLQLYGALTVRRSVVGIPMDSKETLTTFLQTEEIVSSLIAEGVSDITVRLISWDAADIKLKTPTAAKPDPALGGKSGLSRLSSFLASAGIALFGDVEFAYYENGGKGNAAKLIVNLPSKQLSYDYANGFENTSMPWGYNLGGSGLSRFPYGYLRTFPDNMGISTGSFGDSIYSDYTVPDSTRQDTARRFEDISATAASVMSVMVSGGNAHLLPYATWAADIPMSSSGFFLEDELFPFYQIALSGLVELSGTPINESPNPERTALLSLAWGCSISMRVAAAIPDIIKDSRYNSIMAADYSSWEDDLLRYYGMLKQIELLTEGTKLMSVTTVQDGVYVSAYENGAFLLTNTNPNSVKYRSYEIPPMSIQEAPV